MSESKTSGDADDEGEVRTRKKNFIETIIDEHNASGRYGGKVHTRFPPEPNGYLHLGHAKSICLNFGLAESYGGLCNLRFDDTNPTKENVEFVENIQNDVRWLGFDWGDRLFFASDYFETLYEWAVKLINDGKAFVCDLNGAEMREYRGTLTEPGRNSPFRDRSVEENLDLFKRMRAGEFEDGARTLRAKIDMASPNLNLRDPVMYRILRAHHHRTGDDWCIYPTYDWTHGSSDSIEGITHSICTLEFENHRPLYDWFLEACEVHHPRQIEFAGLGLTYTILSKRRLGKLVAEGHVKGWDDPRMPTLSGIRRRGFPPAAIREFCAKIGVSKYPGTIELSLLEHTVRAHLNKVAPRTMAVLDPLKLVLVNLPEDHEEWMEAVNNPEDPDAGTRKLPLTRELWIERADFRETAPRKFFRLTTEKPVRLRYGYIIDCVEVVKDEAGEIVELRCEADLDTRSGTGTSDRKCKGTIHWVSAKHARDAEVRLYDTLFTAEDPTDVGEGEEFTKHLNPESLVVKTGVKLEPSLAESKVGEHVQFERTGYFTKDPDSTPEALVFNRTLPLRDSWAKIQKKNQGGQKKGQKSKGKGKKDGQKKGGGKQGQKGGGKPSQGPTPKSP